MAKPAIVKPNCCSYVLDIKALHVGSYYCVSLVHPVVGIFLLGELEYTAKGFICKDTSIIDPLTTTVMVLAHDGKQSILRDLSKPDRSMKPNQRRASHANHCLFTVSGLRANLNTIHRGLIAVDKLALIDAKLRATLHKDMLRADLALAVLHEHLRLVHPKKEKDNGITNIT
jgi:hypothetical protein